MSANIIDSLGRTPEIDVIRVIEVRFLRGAGAYPDPVRQVIALFREDGTPIVELDPTIDPVLHGWVREAGGGEITIVVDRDTAEYPTAGTRVTLSES